MAQDSEHRGRGEVERRPPGEVGAGVHALGPGHECGGVSRAALLRSPAPYLPLSPEGRGEARDVAAMEVVFAEAQSVPQAEGVKGGAGEALPGVAVGMVACVAEQEVRRREAI